MSLLYISNEQLELKIQIQYHLLYSSTKIQMLKYKSNKMLLGSVCRKMQNSDERKKDLNKWKDIWCSWIEKLSIIKMSILLNLIYRFSAVLVKIPASYL